MSSYFIDKLCVQIKCEDITLGDRVDGVMNDFFFMKRDTSNHNSPDIILSISNHHVPFIIPEDARELFSSPFFRVLKSGDQCYLIRGDSYFHLDLDNSVGMGFMDSDFWEGPPKNIQEHFMLCILWLLHKHSLYALHANCVVKEDNGVLLVGGSGSGKSTVGLSLIRQGWKYLSDDVNLIKPGPGDIETLAFQKGFSFDPDLAAHYPEIKRHLEASSPNGRKRFLDIGLVYPDRFMNRTVPKIMIFPQIVSQAESRLRPIERTEALILLMQNSGGIMVNRGIAADQIDVLKNLVYQTACYQLFSGHDLYLEPEKVSGILTDVEII